MTTQNLLEYNAFGIIRLTRQAVTVTITAVQGSRSINRSLNVEQEEPVEELQDGETAVAAFAAWLEPGKKSRITLHEMSELRSGAVIADIKQVGQVLTQAIEQVKKSAGY